VGSGSVGLPEEPLRLSVDGLSGTSGSGGVFLTSPTRGLTVNNVSTTGGDVELAVETSGDLSVVEGISTFVEGGDGGNIFLEAVGNIEVANLDTGGSLQGGNIELTSSSGDITATNSINSSSPDGSGGSVTLDAAGSVNILGIEAGGNAAGGNISIISDSENTVNVRELLTTSSENGSGGNVDINSNGNVNLAGIAASGSQQGGNINITSLGNIDTSAGSLDASSQTGSGGNVNLDAAGAIATGEINTSGLRQGGQLRLASQNNIQTTGNLNSSSSEGIAGSVTIQATGDVILGGNITSIGEVAGGNVDISTTGGNINLSNSNIETFSENGSGGNITLDAAGSVTASNIAAFGNTASGNVTILSGQNAIATGSIQTQAGENAPTGSVTLGNFTAEGNVQNANIAPDENGEPTGSVEAVAPDGSTSIQSIGESNEEPPETPEEADSPEEPPETPEEADSPGEATETPEPEDSLGEATETPEPEDSPEANVEPESGETNLEPESGGDSGPDLQPESGSDSGPDLQPESSDSGPDLQPESSDSEPNLQPESSDSEPNLQPESSDSGPDLQPESSDSDTASNTSSTSDETFVESVENNNEVATNVSRASSNTTNSVTEESYSSDETSIENVARESSGSSSSIESNYTASVMEINLVNASSATAINSTVTQQVALIEQTRNSDFADYFGEDLSNQVLSTKNVRELLGDIAEQTGSQSAVIYVTSYSNELQLVLFTPGGDAILKTVPEAKREVLIEVVKNFRTEITKGPRGFNSYLPIAKQLYQWLIAPIEAELEAANIETLLFSMDEGLRLLPVAALHDGEQFLVEKYSLSLIPSVSLMDPRYRSLQNARVLAMGASEFLELNPLPAVPFELQTITREVWQGSLFLNQQFTLNNLIEQHQGNSYPIIHLATHAEFQPGDIDNSYIQFWQKEKLRLSQVRRLGLNNPAVELLVLSACRTAVGDRNAELGFAGLAVATGVKSVLASLWYVSDEGTLGLMTEFYSNLNDVKIKAEALQRAQIAMLRGEVQINDGFLLGLSARGGIQLPPELANVQNTNLSHPYYWSGFTTIGSPW
jgi:CHAT domain-containing protein